MKLEKELVVEVLPELLALCERVGEASKDLDVDWDKISWAFFVRPSYSDGSGQLAQGAVGFTSFREYSVAVWQKEDGVWVSSVYSRAVSKYDAEGWETHPCDPDFEPEEV